MTPTKLSESDKREILRLYRQSDENTITLSKRYGVSSSTVRRILQNALSEEEYEALVQQKQKRLPHAQSTSSSLTATDRDEPEPTDESEPLYPPVSQSPATKLIRRRSSAAVTSVAETTVTESSSYPSDVSDLPEAETATLMEDYGDDGDLDEMLDEGLLEGEDFSDFDDEEEEEEDLDDFDEGDEDDDSLYEEGLDRSLGAAIQLRSKTRVQVLPLSEASLPKTCYLVVDRAAELITRPLKAFGELGQIPEEEIREKTLPVFDNHRVARRFSTRNQRVFKVPDGRLLQKAAPYLQAKGITRLLIDGQVYSI